MLELETAAVQRRTLAVLFATQIIGGVGSAIGASVGALLAAEIAGVGPSGIAQSASVIGSLIRAYSGPLATVAGIIIIIMGLHFLGVTQIALLHRQKRLEVVKPVGLWGAYVMGLAFAFGWTPCIGPILAAILAVAASEQTVTKGASLLAVYSLGLAIPFVLAGAVFARAMGAFLWLRDYYRAIQFAGGVIMVALGLLLFFGRFYVLRIYVNRLFEWFGLEPVF